MSKDPVARTTLVWTSALRNTTPSTSVLWCPWIIWTWGEESGEGVGVRGGALMESFWWKRIKCTTPQPRANITVHFSRWGRNFGGVLLIFPRRRWSNIFPDWLLPPAGSGHCQGTKPTGCVLNRRGSRTRATKHPNATKTREQLNCHAKTVRGFFILSTSIIRDLCHTVKYNNAPVLSPHEDIPASFSPLFFSPQEATISAVSLLWGPCFFSQIYLERAEPHLF